MLLKVNKNNKNTKLSLKYILIDAKTTNTDKKQDDISVSDEKCDENTQAVNGYNDKDSNEDIIQRIGFCSFRIEYEPNWECNELYIYEIMIDEKYSQQGYGTYLMNLCEFIGLNKKCKQLGLTCFSTANAMKFYKKLGYTPDKYSEQNENVDISDYRLLMKLIST